MNDLKELNFNNVKLDNKKLKFYTGFTSPQLFDIYFDCVSKGQMIEEDEYKLPLSEQFSVGFLQCTVVLKS